MRIPDEVIMEIKYKNPIEEVVSPYVNLKRAGRNLNGLCPFHNEKTPSFTVYPDTASFYCFGCGAGGDAFTFVRKIENLDYVEAVKRLADRAGITIPEGEYDDSYLKLKARIYEINQETARFFHRFLFTEEGRWALDYLTGRGLSVKTIRHFGLGCAPNRWDDLLKHLKSKGYSLSDMEQANVITKGSKGYYDRFRNRVMFPIIELSGKVIGFSGRRHPAEEKGGKYINTSDTPVYKKSKSLFGFNFAKGFCSKQLLVVEGNMDVVSLHQAGFENAIGTLGTAFTSEQARLISRYTSEIVLCFDRDAAGQKAANRAMEVLADSGLKVSVVAVPDGKDPDEFIKKNGKEKFQAVLDGAANEIEFKLFQAAEGIDRTTNDGKSRYLNAVTTALAGISDPISVDLYAGRISEEYGVSKQVLQKEIERKRYQKRKARQKKEIDSVVKPVYTKSETNPERRLHPRAVKAEEELLSVLMVHPDLKTKLGGLSNEDFVSSLNRRIFTAVMEAIARPDGKFDPSFCGDDFTPEEMGYISFLQNRPVIAAHPIQSLLDAMRVLREEKEKCSPGQIGQMDDDEWARRMQKMIDEKRSQQG